jgi:hypothetical protein
MIEIEGTEIWKEQEQLHAKNKGSVIINWDKHLKHDAENNTRVYFLITVVLFVGMLIDILLTKI